jgi:hypothetical protein
MLLCEKLSLTISSGVSQSKNVSFHAIPVAALPPGAMVCDFNIALATNGPCSSK